MSSTEQLIEQLSDNLKPAKTVPGSFKLIMQWFASIIIYSFLVQMIIGLRPDISIKLSSPLFLTEILMLALVVITTCLSAIFLSFPDIRQKRWMVFMPIVSFLLFIAALAAEYFGTDPTSAHIHGIECLLGICLYSLLPAAFMLQFIRNQATTHYYLAGTVSMLFASALGSILLRFAENTDSISHLIQWHYLPMFGFGILGLCLGRVFLKW